MRPKGSGTVHMALPAATGADAQPWETGVQISTRKPLRSPT